jgi:hypothetical protein
MYKFLMFAALFPVSVAAAPACVVPEAKSIVIARSGSNLADGYSAEWRLESVDGTRQILLKPCSGRHANHCYFATDVEPGRYYFKEVVPGASNRMYYPVSKPDFWFELSGQGIDYIGDWTIDRTNRCESVKLRVDYDMKSLDAMVALCRIEGKKRFLGRTASPVVEILE